MPASTPPPPPKKPVIKREGFTIKEGVITCNGHERVDGSRLEKLFHPERVPAPRNQKRAAEEAKRLFSRPFFAAQLRYYGITFPKSATEAQLKSLLDKAVLAQQVQAILYLHARGAIMHGATGPPTCVTFSLTLSHAVRTCPRRCFARARGAQARLRQGA